MAKNAIKKYKFSEVINPKTLPGYIKHYVVEDDKILIAYKTVADHGVFTDKKIIIFDNIGKAKRKKQIYTIPYSSVTTVVVSFDYAIAELSLELINGSVVSLRFDDLEAKDKIRIRLLYTCINRIVCNQEPSKEQLKKLLNDDIEL